MKKLLYLFILCLSLSSQFSHHCDDRDVKFRNDINDLNSRLDALDAQIDAYNKRLLLIRLWFWGGFTLKDYSRDEKDPELCTHFERWNGCDGLQRKSDNEMPQMYIADDGTWALHAGRCGYVLTDDAEIQLLRGR